MLMQLAFFCEELVATQDAAEPMAMARPLVLPTGLEAGVLWAPPHFLPIAITMVESESATVRQPSLLVKVNTPLLEPDEPPSLSPNEAASSELRLALRALARRMPVPISPGLGPLPLDVTFVPPAVVGGVAGAAVVGGVAGATVVVVAPAAAPGVPALPAGAVSAALAGRADSSRANPRANRATTTRRAGRIPPSLLTLATISATYR